MRIGGNLTGYGSQSESLSGIECSGLQPPIIKYKAFGFTIFDKQLSIVGRADTILENLFNCRLVNIKLFQK